MRATWLAIVSSLTLLYIRLTWKWRCIPVAFIMDGFLWLLMCGTPYNLSMLLLLCS